MTDLVSSALSGAKFNITSKDLNRQLSNKPDLTIRWRKDKTWFVTWRTNQAFLFLEWLGIYAKRLFLSCQKEDSFGTGAEELEKIKNQTIAGRGEQNFICQKLRSERQKWRQQFKITLFSPGPQGKIKLTQTKCGISWRTESESKVFIL